MIGPMHVGQDVAHDDPRGSTRPTPAPPRRTPSPSATAPGRARRGRSYIQNEAGEHQDDRRVGAAPNFLSAMARIAMLGDDQEQVGEPHQQLVGPARRSSRRRRRPSVPTTVESDRDREADLQRDLAGVEDAGELVAAELVGAEPVLAAGRRRPSSRSWSFLGYGASQLGAEAQRRRGGSGRQTETTATLWRRKRRRKSCHCDRATRLRLRRARTRRRRIGLRADGADAPSRRRTSTGRADPARRRLMSAGSRVEHAVEHVGEQVEEDDEDRGRPRSRPRARGRRRSAARR